MNLRDIFVRPVRPSEEQQYQGLMEEHHYLGSLPKIGETLWYVASWHDAMGSPSQLFRRSLEVRGTGSLDRMELPPSV